MAIRLTSAGGGGASPDVTAAIEALQARPTIIYGLQADRIALDPATLANGTIFSALDGAETPKPYIVVNHAWTVFSAPSHHVSQHATGGVDALTPSAIGAVAESTRNLALGFAGLGSDGLVDSSYLPITSSIDATTLDTFSVDTEVALGATAVFTGEPRDALNYFGFQVAASASGAFTVKVQTSSDATTWTDQALGLGTGLSVDGTYKAFVSVPVVSRYVRVAATAGAADLSSLRVISRLTLTSPLGSRMRWRGDWAASTVYYLDDIVQYGGVVYKATTNLTSGTLFNGTNWTALSVLPGASKSSVAGGRPIVATRLAHPYVLIMSPQNTPNTSKSSHVALTNISDVRVQYAAPLAASSDGALNSITFDVGLEDGSGNVYQVYFQGKKSFTLDPGGFGPISDPVPVDIPSGTTFYFRVFQTSGWPNSLTINTNAVVVGDSTLSLSAIPLDANGQQILGPVVVGTGGAAELLRIKSYSGSSAPFTANLVATAAQAHATGTVVGGQSFLNRNALGSEGDKQTTGSTDLSQSGTIGNLSQPSTTLTSAASIGDQTIQVANALLLLTGTTLIIDTAGNAETVTVRSTSGTANPYTIYLTAPLTKAHSSGVSAFGTSTGSGPLLAPVGVYADRVGSAPPPTVLLVGDSIINGTGYSLRANWSFATIAFEGNHPVINISLAGESAQQFTSFATYRRRKQLFDLASWAIFEYGVNDIYGSRTLAQVKADATTIITWLRNRGLKVAMTTLTPRTTSTDTWATTGNQTIVNSGTMNAVRLQYNAWVRAGADGLADMILEVADTVETARDSGIWKADASGPYTVDGIHPSIPGHNLMAAAINQAAFT